MVFIPVYSDQFRNAKRCVDGGYAEMLSFHEVTVKMLYEQLNQVLDDKSYSNRALQVSQQFRDNLVDPMEESMYWIEFLARHRHNYPIFKPYAPNVSWFAYLYLDILLVAIIALYVIFVATRFGLKVVWHRYNAEESIKQKVQ